MKIQSLSTKRLIVEAVINGRQASFLIDTGASVGLIAEDKRKSFGLVRGKRYNGTLIGGSGNEIDAAYICDSIINLGDKQINQFLLADISGIRSSISRETGVEILGIIGLNQMKNAGITINTMQNFIDL